MFRALEDEGVVARALAQGIAELHLWNPRDYALDPHRTVDDRPYGGGPGMVMKVEPCEIGPGGRAGRGAGKSGGLSLSPGPAPGSGGDGRPLPQASGWILIAGRYEGIDERLIEDWVDEEWSIGDYVLSGGELAAMVVMDAVIRLLPGALGHADSAGQDSYADGLLDRPHYTRPREIDGRLVPSVLLSGDHAADRTLAARAGTRPDLAAPARFVAAAGPE